MREVVHMLLPAAPTAEAAGRDGVVVQVVATIATDFKKLKI